MTGRRGSGRASGKDADYAECYAHVAAVGHMSYAEIDRLPMPRFLQLLKVERQSLF